MKGRDNVTSKQMALFTYVAQTGLGVIILPTVMAKEVGHDGWISLFFSGFLAIIMCSLFMYLLKRYKDKSIYDINKLLFGKLIGFCFNFLLVIYLVLAAARGLRVFTLFLKLTVLPLSPTVAITPFILLPSIYLLWQGLKYVCRFKYISLLSYAFVLLFLLVMIREVRWSFLLPVGESGLKQLFKSVPISILTYIGFELIVFLFAEVTDKEKVFKNQIIANLASMTFFIFVVVICTGVFGEHFLKIQSMPLFNTTRAYNAPILERVDIYLVSLWFIAMECSMRAYMFTAYHGLQKVLKIKKSKLSLLIFFIIIVALSMIPQDYNQAFLFVNITNCIGVGVSLFFLFCLCLSFFKKKGVFTQ